jgi:uncharacterized membrane-anchored protein YjiN (DUF445 family)
VRPHPGTGQRGHEARRPVEDAHRHCRVGAKVPLDLVGGASDHDVVDPRHNVGEDPLVEVVGHPLVEADLVDHHHSRAATQSRAAISSRLTSSSCRHGGGGSGLLVGYTNPMASLDTSEAEAEAGRPRVGDEPPRPANIEARRAHLARMRRRATGMLVAVTGVFVGLQVWGSDDTWVGYLEAAVEASMVGGLADWFAVTALFRHPLGIPIPHTAVIPERKDQFGETLGDFVQTSFLTPDIIAERVRTARVVPRLAMWLADPDNAARLSRHLADAAVTAADLLRDDEVHRALEEVARRRIETTPLAPIAGKALAVMTEDGRHHDLLDVMLRAVDRFLTDNRASLRARFSEESPWWLPEAAEDRIFQRLLDGARSVLGEVARNPQHELRRDFDARVRRLVDELQSSPAMRARGEELKNELLAQPELRAWVTGVWSDVKAGLRAQAGDPRSELRRRLADTLMAFGQRLLDDPALAKRVEHAIETGVRYVADQFSDELGTMVSGTVARWDGRETADRLELLLGPDLQFIRINGTVVGGLAGVLIHAVSQGL